jgi:outer membrane protein assembly factor BamB
MDHHVYALDRQTGQQIWRTDVGGSISGSVALADGIVYAGGVDRMLHALSAEDGSEVWASDQLPGWIMGKPLVTGGYVYVGTLRATVHAFAADSGTRRWPDVEIDGAVRAGPVIADGNLVVVTDLGGVYAIDVETGSRTEIYSAEAGLLAQPAVFGETVYTGTTVGRIIALNMDAPGNPVAWEYPSD